MSYDATACALRRTSCHRSRFRVTLSGLYSTALFTQVMPRLNEIELSRRLSCLLNIKTLPLVSRSLQRTSRSFTTVSCFQHQSRFSSTSSAPTVSLKENESQDFPRHPTLLIRTCVRLQRITNLDPRTFRFEKQYWSWKGLELQPASKLRLWPTCHHKSTMLLSLLLLHLWMLLWWTWWLDEWSFRIVGTSRSCCVGARSGCFCCTDADMLLIVFLFGFWWVRKRFGNLGLDVYCWELQWYAWF